MQISRIFGISKIGVANSANFFGPKKSAELSNGLEHRTKTVRTFPEMARKSFCSWVA